MRTAMWCYVGAYTGHSATGIGVFAVDDGELIPASAVTDVADASFLAASPDGRHLYAVSERAPEGAVIAFTIDAETGALHEIDRIASGGAAPCHLAIDPLGRFVYVAHYGSGSVAAVALRPDGGFGTRVIAEHAGSGPHPRQDAPHAHGVALGTSGEWLHVVDLGTDRIERYASPIADRAWSGVGHVEVPPGAGPRHLVLDPDRRRAFAVAELDCTLLTFDLDPDTGALACRHVTTLLPDGVKADSLAAAIGLRGGGRHLDVTVRGDDIIATFDVAEIGGAPRLLGHVGSGGRGPRHLTVDPSGVSIYVANQGSDAVHRFTIDPDTGLPRPLGVAAEVSQPVCVVLVEVER